MRKARYDWERPSLNQLTPANTSNLIAPPKYHNSIKCAISVDLKVVARKQPLVKSSIEKGVILMGHF